MDSVGKAAALLLLHRPYPDDASKIQIQHHAQIYINRQFCCKQGALYAASMVESATWFPSRCAGVHGRSEQEGLAHGVLELAISINQEASESKPGQVRFHFPCFMIIAPQVSSRSHHERADHCKPALSMIHMLELHAQNCNQDVAQGIRSNADVLAQWTHVCCCQCCALSDLIRALKTRMQPHECISTCDPPSLYPCRPCRLHPGHCY